MRCERCGSNYRTTVEYEKLVVKGELAPVCQRCVSLSPFAPKRPEREKPPKKIGWGTGERLPGRLIRVDLKDGDGGRKSFMSINRTKPRRVGNVTYEPKTNDPRVQVIYSTQNSQIRSELPQQIQTNLMAVMLTRRPLWFQKYPSCVDRFTGVNKITVPFRDIKDIRYINTTAPSNRFELFDAYVEVETTDGLIVATVERSPRHRTEARRIDIVPKRPGQL